MPGTRIHEATERIGPPGYDPFWDRVDSAVGHYDRQGNPISMRGWVELTEGDTGKRVAESSVTTAGGLKVWISTVWLGLDHGFGYSDHPVIFETMAFHTDSDGEIDFECQDMDRYSHLESAFRGHSQMVGQFAQDWWLDLGGRA
jgi:hypothetical protein